MDLEPLGTDPRFATPEARAPNLSELVELLDAQVVQRPASEWVEQLRQADIPCSIVQDYGMIRQDPQAQANSYVHETDHPVWGQIATQGLPSTYSKTPAEISSHAPVKPGDSSIEILREAGFSESEVEALRATRAVMGGN